MFTLVAVGATWVRSELLDSRSFASTARDVLDSPPVTDLLVQRISDPVVSRLPPAARDRQEEIEAGVARVVASPEFGETFEIAVEEAHRTLVEDRAGTVALDLSPAIGLVRDAVGRTDPRFAAAVDEGDLAAVAVGDGDDFPDLSRADDLAGTTIASSVVGAAASLGLAVLASTHRSRLLAWTALGLGAAAASGVFVLSGLPGAVADRAVDRGADPQVRAAIGAVFDAVFSSLRVALGGIAAVAVSGAAVAAFWPRRAIVARVSG